MQYALSILLDMFFHCQIVVLCVFQACKATSNKEMEQAYITYEPTNDGSQNYLVSL